MAVAPSMIPSFNKLYGDEGQSQEFKDLLSSLPREDWLFNPPDPLYQYQGYRLPAQILQGVVKSQTEFKAQPTDLFLVTPPKSGTTWLKAMAFAAVNRVHYPPDHEEQHPLLAKNPHELVPFVEFALIGDHVPDFSSLGAFGSPRIFGSHVPYPLLPESVRSSKCKIVYLCRNPKDTLVSFWCFINKIQPLQRPNSLEAHFEYFCKGASLYGPFWDNVLGYWKQSLENPETVCFMKFEDMKKDPMAHLRKLAEFIGCPFSLEEENQGVLEGVLKLCSFDNLSNLKVNKGEMKDGEMTSPNKGEMTPSNIENDSFFRRGEVGDWVNYLTPEMSEQLDRITEEKLHGSGLKF